MAKSQVRQRPAAKITVAVLEDVTAVLDGMRFALDKPDIQLCGIGDNLDDFLAALKTCKPMVAIVDLRIGNDHDAGFTAIQRARESSPATRFIVFTAYDELSYFHKAINLGANAFVVKRSNEISLDKAVRIVAAGGTYYGELLPQYLEKVKEKPFLVDDNGQDDSSPREGLTARELQILGLLDKGLSNKEIAVEMVVSPNTIKTHTNSIRKKLGVKTTPEALRTARLRGILLPDSPPSS